MSVWSIEFGRADLTTAAGVQTTLGTVPAGKVWVVKDLSGVGLNSGTIGARFSYSKSGVVTPFYATPVLTLNQEAHTNSRQVVLLEGDLLLVTGHTLTGSGRIFVRAGGYELTADPP